MCSAASCCIGIAAPGGGAGRRVVIGPRGPGGADVTAVVRLVADQAALDGHALPDVFAEVRPVDGAQCVGVVDGLFAAELVRLPVAHRTSFGVGHAGGAPCGGPGALRLLITADGTALFIGHAREGTRVPDRGLLPVHADRGEHEAARDHPALDAARELYLLALLLEQPGVTGAGLPVLCILALSAPQLHRAQGREHAHPANVPVVLHSQILLVRQNRSRARARLAPRTPRDGSGAAVPREGRPGGNRPRLCARGSGVVAGFSP
jgi:hypothetical protein